jgi:putative flippase GtrA
MTTTTGLAEGHSRPLPAAALGTSVSARFKGAPTFIRFLFAGAISFAVNQALLYLLYEHLIGARSLASTGALRHLDAGLLLASAVALEVSILVRFALNDSWTFRARRDKPFSRRLAESNLSSLGSPAISLAAVNLLTPLLGISYLFANAIGVLIGLAWNWAWSNRVVWRPAPALQPVEVEVTR